MLRLDYEKICKKFFYEPITSLNNPLIERCYWQKTKRCEAMKTRRKTASRRLTDCLDDVIDFLTIFDSWHL